MIKESQPSNFERSTNEKRVNRIGVPLAVLTLLSVTVANVHAEGRLNTREAVELAEELLSARQCDSALAVYESALASVYLDSVGTEIMTRAMWGIGAYYSCAGQYEEATSRWRALIQQYEASGNRNHVMYACLLGDLGSVESLLGNYATAESLLVLAWSELQRGDSLAILPFGRICTLLGVVMTETGRFEKAETMFRVVLEMYSEFGVDSTEIAGVLACLGRIRRDQCDLVGADALFGAALAIYTSRYLGDHLDVATALHNVSSVRRKQRRYHEADSLLDTSSEIVLRIVGTTHPRWASALIGLAEVKCEQSEWAIADSLATRALEVIENSAGPATPEAGDALSIMGRLQFADGKFDSALTLFARASTIGRATLPAGHLKRFGTEGDLAAALLRVGRFGEASETLRASLTALEPNEVWDTLGFDQIVDTTIALLYQRGATDEALRLSNCPRR